MQGQIYSLKLFHLWTRGKKEIKAFNLKKRTNKIKENRWNNKWNRADNNLIELNRKPRNKPE